MVAPLDNDCVGLSDSRDCTRKLVGLLRVGLGWLVVLGSRGKRFVYALAMRHSAHAFALSDGEAWKL